MCYPILSLSTPGVGVMRDSDYDEIFLDEGREECGSMNQRALWQAERAQLLSK